MPVSRSTEVGDEGAGGGAAEKAVGVASRRRTTRRLKRGACVSGARFGSGRRARRGRPQRGGDGERGRRPPGRGKRRVRARGLAVSVAALTGGVGQEEGEDSGVTALLT